jgi:hypothetical protein
MKLGMEQVGQKLNDLNTARGFLAGCRNSNTAALTFGGLLTIQLLTLQTMKLGMEQVGQQLTDLNTARRGFRRLLVQTQLL